MKCEVPKCNNQASMWLNLRLLCLYHYDLLKNDDLRESLIPLQPADPNKSNEKEDDKTD